MSEWSQIFMLMVTLLMLIKTFFFLRIFKELSFLVTMIKQVMIDLKVFMLFFFILLLMFAIGLSVLDYGNYEYNADPSIREVVNLVSYSGQEYIHVNKFLANFISVYRISLGDFDFGASTVMPPFTNGLFWCLWLLVVTITCIVFLNFIIAEVSASYQKVKDNVDVNVIQERGTLINESEDMLKARFGNQIKTWDHLFPKFIISR